LTSRDKEWRRSSTRSRGSVESITRLWEAIPLVLSVFFIFTAFLGYCNEKYMIRGVNIVSLKLN
jgi:hypothetical protein